MSPYPAFIFISSMLLIFKTPIITVHTSLKSSDPHHSFLCLCWFYQTESVILCLLYHQPTSLLSAGLDCPQVDYLCHNIIHVYGLRPRATLQFMNSSLVVDTKDKQNRKRKRALSKQYFTTISQNVLYYPTV